MNIKNKQIDALLIHCYWYNIDKKGELDIANHLQVLAAGILWKKCNIKKIVITGGNVFKGRIAIGEEIQKELLVKLPQTVKKSIIVIPTARTTLGEIREYKKIIDIHGWQNLSSLGLQVHLPRIKSTFCDTLGPMVNRNGGILPRRSY